MTTLAPLYMWAGGKGRLVKKYDPIWPEETFDSYVEPFFGGGAVFAWLRGRNPHLAASVNDSNTELMGLLTAVKDAPDALIEGTNALIEEYLAQPAGLAERKEWYYLQRKAYWADPTPTRLLLLMRLGFNGIWQTCKDSKGLYGTPAGLLKHTEGTQVVSPDQVRAWSEALKDSTITAGDYANVQIPGERSLVYLDPPYRDSFTTYGVPFDDTEQRRVALWAQGVAEEGHLVVIANRCVEGDTFFEDLLPKAKFHYFDVTYTAGRRKRSDDGSFSAKQAREFVAVLGARELPEEF